MLQFTFPPLPHFILCGEDTYPAGGKHPDRTGIGVFDLLLVTRGCLHLEEESLPLSVPAGSYALLRPDRSHRTSEPCREETHFYWVHFQTSGSWGEAGENPEVQESLPASPYHPIRFANYVPRLGRLESPDSAYSWLRRLLALQEDPSAASLWRQQLHFHELLMLLQEEAKLPESGSYLKIAEDAAAFLRKSYRETINYKAMSEELHFHPNYISLCMKRAYGSTPLEYLTRFRVEQAKRLLIDTNDPVGRIAEETGFRSFPYFVRCFGRLVGTTPKSYRMRYRRST